MHNVRTAIVERFASTSLVLRAALAIGCAALVCGCHTDQQVVGAPSVPSDYRLRHPITITEKVRTFQLFIGANRSSLTPTQRAQLLAFAQNWRGEATGGVVIDVPIGSNNGRSSRAAVPEIESILAVTGVPRRSIAVHKYPVAASTLATVRVSYPEIAAQVGPCGMWPGDLGTSLNRDYSENQPPWNFGCTTQRNLAAMVANPEDLVQPRAETPAYTMRRTTVLQKYESGQATGTQYSNPNAGKISGVGQ